MHKIIIVSIFGRLLGFLGVLGFVAFIVSLTNNTKFLWLLFLLLTVGIIPIYETQTAKIKDNIKKENEDNL